MDKSESESKFDFISDEKLKVMLIRDYEELQICLKHGALKSVLILSGGIIEAVLLEYFTHNLPNNTTLEDIVGREEVRDASGNVMTKFKSGWSLEKFINQAKTENLVSEKIQQLSHLVRNYRNLIHPAKEFRTLAEFDEETAKMSLSLVNMILKEVKINYAKKYSSTAEMVFKKIRQDEASFSIFGQLLDTINQNEKDKLLEMVTKYQINSDLEFKKELYSKTKKLTPNLSTFFKAVKNAASPTKLLEQLEILIKLIEQGEEHEIILLFDLYSDSLDLLTEEKKEFVLLYVFGVLQTYIQRQYGLNSKNLSKFSVLSKYLNNPKILENYYTLLLNILVNYFNHSRAMNYINFHNTLFNELTQEQMEESNTRFKIHFADHPDFIDEILNF